MTELERLQKENEELREERAVLRRLLARAKGFVPFVCDLYLEISDAQYPKKESNEN